MKQSILYKKWKILILALLIPVICLVFLILPIGCNNHKSDSQASTIKKLIPDTLSWAVRMADSEIYRRGDSLSYGKGHPKAKWNYQTGLFLKALLDLYQKTEQQKYFSYVQTVIDSYLEDDGGIKTYKREDYNIDMINPGKVLLYLYQITGDDKYKNSAFLLRQQLEEHPRTSEGGLWHKKKYPWQMWLDGIYMGAPFYAEFSMMFDKPEGFDDVVNQILLIDVHTRDPETGLRYHAWDESNKQNWANPVSGCSPHFWGRAMGWYAMALVDVMDFLPATHPKYEQIIFIIKDLSKSIVTFQDEQTGLWYQILNQEGREGNYLEASASAMFVYFLAKAVNKGYINETYKPIAERGYQGLLNHLITVEQSGLVNLTQICSVAGLGGNPYRDGSYEYYISEQIVENDLKGVGPFIMASLQIENTPALQ